MDPRRAVAIRIMETLENAGFEAYLVGGCVRDEMLKKKPQDYDVATSAHPNQVESLFEHTVPTGLKHGTVTVVVERIPVEVTTFRVESDYEDYRRPSTVEFVTSLQQDLARRDFTINAMAKDRHGRIYDFFSGISDLEKGIVRTVGNPVDRFREDALRMLRAVRFATQFAFQIDEETGQAICQLKQAMKHISVERIRAEIEKMWLAQRASIGINLFFQYGLIHCMPPFHHWEMPDSLEREKISSIDHASERIVRWAYFLWLIGSTEQNIHARLIQLRLSSADIMAIETCFRLGISWTEKNSEQGKRLLLKEGLEAVKKGSQLAALIGRGAQAEPFTIWWQEMPIKEGKELNVNGKELIEHCGQPGGPWVKETLNYLLEQVALGRIPNEKEVLLKEGCHFGTQHSR